MKCLLSKHNDKYLYASLWKLLDLHESLICACAFLMHIQQGNKILQQKNFEIFSIVNI